MATDVEDYPNHQPEQNQSDCTNNEDDNSSAKTKKTGKLIFSPFITLMIFSFINLLAYFDRGALPALLKTIETNFKLSGTQSGLLGSIFMVGYMIGSPIMAHLVHTIEPFYVFSIGLAAWVGAVILCGISSSFIPLLLGRLLSGFGEAGFLIIAPPLIDRMAPSSQRSLWLSIFYLGIPVGYALGFSLPSRLLDVAPFQNDTWRSVFILEGLLMIPFVIFGLFNRSPFSFGQESESDHKFGDADLLPHQHQNPYDTYTPPHHHTTNNLDLEDLNNKSNQPLLPTQNDSSLSLNSYSYENNDSGSGDYSGGDAFGNPSSHQDNELQSSSLYRFIHGNPFLVRIYVLFCNPLYIFNVLGYSAQTFVTGGFAFYGIKYAQAVFAISNTTAGLVFGGVTLFSGIAGTLIGGIWLDSWRRSANIPSATEPADKLEKMMEANPKCADLTGPQREAFKLQLLTKLQDLHNPDVIKDRLQSIELALRLVIIATSIAIPFALTCFLISDLRLFAVLICIAEISLFCCLSVLNSAIIWSVPFNLSPQAIAFSVVIVHLLGDSLSPLLIGVLIDITHGSYRTVMIVCCFPLALAVLLWSMGNGRTLSYLSSIRYWKYSDHPTYITPDNTRASYPANLSDRQFEELQPFVRIRKKLLWPVAEECH